MAQRKQRHSPSKRYRIEGKGDVKILYQDKVLVVVEKPCGILSVPYHGATCRTVVGMVEDMMRRAGTYSYPHRPLAVHRLDRDTSGVMMIALGERWRKVIMDNWKSMVTQRLYHALVERPQGAKAASCPLLHQECGTIGLMLASDKYGRTFAVKANEQKTQTKGKGEKLITARTHYKVLLRGKEYMLVELSLDTGRKNQIRAHLSALGCPVAGDEVRGARTNPLGTLALRARTLAFIHPQTGKEMSFDCPESAKWSALAAAEGCPVAPE